MTYQQTDRLAAFIAVACAGGTVAAWWLGHLDGWLAALAAGWAWLCVQEAD